MLQKYFYFQDLIKIKLQKLPRILLLKNSFQDVSLSRNGPDRDSGHFVSFRDCPGQYGTPGHPILNCTISNIYVDEKSPLFPLFIPSKMKVCYIKYQLLWKRRQDVVSWFLFSLWTSTSPHPLKNLRPPEPDPSTLRVEIIN